MAESVIVQFGKLMSVFVECVGGVSDGGVSVSGVIASRVISNGNSIRGIRWNQYR